MYSTVSPFSHRADQIIGRRDVLEPEQADPGVFDALADVDAW